MNNMFLIATAISIFFLLGKFIEMNFIEKESKPFKFIMRDTLIAYVSAILGILIIDQLAPIVSDAANIIVPTAFTDDPSF